MKAGVKSTASLQHPLALALANPSHFCVFVRHHCKLRLEIRFHHLSTTRSWWQTRPQKHHQDRVHEAKLCAWGLGTGGPDHRPLDPLVLPLAIDFLAILIIFPSALGCTLQGRATIGGCLNIWDGECSHFQHSKTTYIQSLGTKQPIMVDLGPWVCGTGRRTISAEKPLANTSPLRWWAPLAQGPHTKATRPGKPFPRRQLWHSCAKDWIC